MMIENESYEMKSTIDRAYEEGSSTLKHYSTALRNVRAIAIAQGFVVLSGVAYLAKDGNVILFVICALFGVFLTAIIGTLHENYHQNVIVSLDHLVDIERKFFASEIALWSKLIDARNKRYKSPLFLFLLNKAIYYLIVLAMITLVFINILVTKT